MRPAVPPGVQDALDLPGEVREEDRLDPERLGAFLRGAFPCLSGPVEVEQFRKGHSNLTYLIRFGGREAVLRRAPHGANVKSAHDMRREFTILSALQGVYAKAPGPLAFCDDPAVAGAEFYLMERVRGVILRRGGVPGVELRADLLSALSTAFADGLAELHAVDGRRGPSPQRLQVRQPGPRPGRPHPHRGGPRLGDGHRGRAAHGPGEHARLLGGPGRPSRAAAAGLR